MDDLALGIPAWHAVYVEFPDERGWVFLWGGEVPTRDAVLEANYQRQGRRAKVYRDRLALERLLWPRRDADLVHATGVAPEDLEAEMEMERRRRSREHAGKVLAGRYRRDFAGRSLAPVSPTRW